MCMLVEHIHLSSTLFVLSTAAEVDQAFVQTSAARAAALAEQLWTVA